MKNLRQAKGYLFKKSLYRSIKYLSFSPQNVISNGYMPKTEKNIRKFQVPFGPRTV